MGLMQHHAIIATTWSTKHFDAVRDWCESGAYGDLFRYGCGVVNDERTVVMVPDGSKEGWPESDTGDNIRSLFIERLRQDHYEDRSSPWMWVEVTFGELGAKLVQTNCEDAT